MSYRGSGYRGPGDRSRSPPRFSDRRPSNASIFDGRHSGPPPRNASDAPRGPRSQFDGPPARGPPPGSLGSGGAPRTLRDAPPLGTTDRARPFIRERDYSDRRERSPPPRERSPPRKFAESRDFPPRDLDVRSARRASRDGPPSAGSNYSDNPPFSASSSFRGGFGRGRGRGGDFFDRGGARGGRRAIDDRGDLFRRERSPPSRFGRDLSRDGRDPERRDERRFDRRDDERRPEWHERDDRARRDPPPGRLESRVSSDSMPTNASYQSSQAPPINPERLAIIESSGADTSLRRPSTASVTPAKRDGPPETPAYLNGRAETTANRYGSRGSSPPTQAPPVPAFSFSVAPSSAAHQPAQTSKLQAEPASVPDDTSTIEEPKPSAEEKPAPPANAPTAPKAAPSAPKAHHASPPPTAPKAPRALEIDATIPASNRLHGVRSLENLAGPNTHQSGPPSAMPASPLSSRQSLPHMNQPVSPNPAPAPRFGDLSAPTGPKAVRTSPAQMSPRPTFASPRSDLGVFQHGSGIQRGQTPPPSAPSGPRNRSFSVSPKVPASSIPTAPKAARAPVPTRPGERSLASQTRPPERPAAMPPIAAPSGPRNLQWNQWRRPGAPTYGEKPGAAVPAKRDASGEEKEKQFLTGPAPSSSSDSRINALDTRVKAEDHESRVVVASAHPQIDHYHEDRMDVDEPSRRKSAHNNEGHSARQSFFGKTLEKSEDEIASSSEDDLSEDEDETLLEAKHARKERELKAQMIDLGAREYRATSPLESIARLARLSTKDLERVAATQHEEEMDVDEHVSDPAHLVPPVAQTSESDEGPDILTPQGEDAAAIAIREQEGLDSVRRVRRASPNAISLPYLLKGEEPPPLNETAAFQENLSSLEESAPEVMAALDQELQAAADAEADAEATFAEYYRVWREECEALDKEKDEAERAERQQSAEPGPISDIPLAAPAIPIMEGRRLHKYNVSEYVMEQVLKQSEETARIEQEKLDREAKKVQADMEKEARLPDQQAPDVVARTCLIDANTLRDSDSLTLVFSYEPPTDTFTESEQNLFIAAFKETPKRWGEIASLLPGRTYKDCIHHYYANKWDGRFRDNKGRKLKGGRRGRGGKARPSRGSALMADLKTNEDLVAPNDSASGRPKRAAAPTTFGEREVESKNSLTGQSPAKKLGPGAKDGNGDAGGEKPAKKQRRAAGEAKPGRKAKAQPQLAALAAAPLVSPNKQFLQGVHTKEELTRAQNLEDANLLANLQAGQHGMLQPDGQVVFSQDGFTRMGEEADRPKPAAPAAKQSASSYWSVPEQNDFFKYIAHFGTDFGAIASHMGTKTQTMIKNHYQRQIDGGRADLEEAAMKANGRRERGEDIGPPPTPTPIVKRKYDNPQSSTPRAIAPQTEPMEVDEPVRAHPAPPKHASPPQPPHYQAKPQYTTSAQSTPIPAQRVVPSPLPTASTPAPPPVPAASHPRGLQHPLGSRLGFLADARSESRSGMPQATSFRMGQEPPPAPQAPRSQPPPAQPARTSSNAPDAQFIQNLQREQERAIRMQQAEGDSEPRVEPTYMRQPPAHVPHGHGSPAHQPLAAPAPDRKPPFEERGPTPPRGAFSNIGSSRPPLFGPNAGPPFASPFPISGRGNYNQSPPTSRPETSRPGSVPTSAPLQPPAPTQPPAVTSTPAPAPAATPAPAPEPPKRSNLLSILNSDPEEIKPPKRDSLPTPNRVASPAPAAFPQTSAPQSIPGISSRRETFGQASQLSSFHRPSFSQGSSTPAPPPANLKHEAPSGGIPSMQQHPKQDWPPRVMDSRNHPSPPNPAPLDRDPRPSYYHPSHRSSVFSALGTPRANPSPPPGAMHSRTPSLSTQQQTAPPPRDQRSMLGGPPHGAPHPSSQSLHSNPYGGQPQFTPFSQGPAQIQNRAHHSHNNSINEGPSLVRRYEEDVARQDQRFQIAHEQRQRVDQFHAAQRAQEQDMERQRQQQEQQAYGRAPMPHQSMHPPFSSPFGPSRMQYGIRAESARDADMAVQEQRRFQEDQERRRQEQQPPPMPPQQYRESPTDYRRRTDDAQQLFRRTTPYGGSAYAPPPGRR